MHSILHMIGMTFDYKLCHSRPTPYVSMCLFKSNFGSHMYSIRVLGSADEKFDVGSRPKLPTSPIIVNINSYYHQ